MKPEILQPGNLNRWALALWESVWLEQRSRFVIDAPRDRRSPIDSAHSRRPCPVRPSPSWTTLAASFRSKNRHLTPKISINLKKSKRFQRANLVQSPCAPQYASDSSSRLNQRLRGNAQTFMQTPNHFEAERSFTVQDLVYPVAFTDHRLKIFHS
jgi:hypothetical protein